MSKYDVDYFIAKFEAIPNKQWCAGSFENDKGQRCAFGHCGEGVDDNGTTPESDGLFNVFRSFKHTVADINDGLVPEYDQPTPKARILAALHDIKSGKVQP